MNPPNNPNKVSDTASWFSGSNTSIPSFINMEGAAPSAPGNATGLGSNSTGEQQQPTTNISATALKFLTDLRTRLQPWSEFFRFSKFGVPPGVAGIGPRVKKNVQTFLSNYLCLFLILLIYCILTSLLMLLTLLVLAGLCYTIYQRSQKGPINVAGYEIPPSLLYTLALMVCIPLFALSNAGQVIYWVIGAGFLIMLSHAVFYASEEVPGADFEVVTNVHVQQARV